jgi:hypothetical protein
MYSNDKLGRASALMLVAAGAGGCEAQFKTPSQASAAAPSEAATAEAEPPMCGSGGSSNDSMCANVNGSLGDMAPYDVATPAVSEPPFELSCQGTVTYDGNELNIDTTAVYGNPLGSPYGFRLLVDPSQRQISLATDQGEWKDVCSFGDDCRSAVDDSSIRYTVSATKSEAGGWLRLRQIIVNIDRLNGRFERQVESRLARNGQHINTDRTKFQGECRKPGDRRF